VLVGGRGKAGGVKLAKDAAEAEQLATQILGMEIKGLPVRKVLVDEASAIDQEIYFAITDDRSAKKPVMIASAAGGIDIEEVAAKTPEKIIKVNIDPLLGLREYQARDVAVAIDLPREYWKDFVKIAMGLWEVYKGSDATLAEIARRGVLVVRCVQFGEVVERQGAEIGSHRRWLIDDDRQADHLGPVVFH
jgi:succinyl-CoA synthetase beta subunit